MQAEFRPIAALLLLASTLACPLSAQRFPFRHYDADDGLDSPYVRVLAEDHDGFLWAGTTSGLYRFDGERFDRFGPNDGLPPGPVRAIHVDRHGQIWVATRQGLAVREGIRFRQIEIPSGIEVAQAGHLASAGHTLYVAARQGVAAIPLLPPRRPLLLPSPPGAAKPQAMAIHADTQGVLWVGCGLELCRVAGDRLELVPETGLPLEAWDAILSDAAGALWVRSMNQLWRRPPGATRFDPVPGDFPRSNGIVALFLDQQRQVAIPTEVGLFRQSPDGWERIAERQGLPADPVTHALWDRAGNLWIAMESYGIARLLGGGAWTSWTTADGLSHNRVVGFARDPLGALWIGTKRGLDRMGPTLRDWRSWRRPQGLPSESLRSLVIDPAGGIWAGFDSAGLTRLDSRTFALRNFGPADGLSDSRVVSLTAEPNGTLWVPTRDGLYRADTLKSPIRFERVPVPAHHGENIIYRVLRTRDGRLWAAGRQGLLLRDDSGWRHFTSRDGLLHTQLAFLAEDGQGGLWIGYGPVSGVSRLLYRPGSPLTLQHFDHDNGLASNDISFLETDHAGRVWIGTDQGIDCYDRGRFSHYGADQGLIWQDAVFNAFLAEPGGSLWFGTTRGFSRFRSPAAPLPAIAPLVHFTQVETRTGLHSPSALLRLPHRARYLRVRFSSPVYSAGRSIDFRYRLSGAPAEWNYTSRRELVLQDLPSGDHRLEVQARAFQGPWGPTSTLRFSVDTPWWSSWWFAAFSLSLLSASVFLVWRQRFQRHLLRQRELEAAVAQRTREIELEKQKVESQKRDIELLLDEARQASRLRDQFLANVSHEIRTPMNGVIGMTSLALGTRLDAEQREYLEAVDASARSLLHLLNDILDFSKLDAGRLELEQLPFSLPDLLDSVQRPFQMLAREKTISLGYSLAPGIPHFVTGDPHRLRQVLVNLHSNAIKFTAEGKVHLEVTPLDRQDGRCRLLFSLTDSGIGIPADKLESIFDPFRQADGSTTRRYGGTGLGLAICRRLVEAMQGTITVESEPGRGSRFSFDIAFAAANHNSPPAQETSTPVPPGLRVLLVEDNEIGRRMASRLLEKYGCSVSVAATGHDAFTLATRQRFDTILMDLQMPGIDGLEATRLIRQAEAASSRRTPIIVLTANASADDRDRSLAAGADGFLSKPLDLVQLQRALARFAPTPPIEKQ